MAKNPDIITRPVPGCKKPKGFLICLRARCLHFPNGRCLESLKGKRRLRTTRDPQRGADSFPRGRR